MTNVFFIGDTHFGHSRIIEFEKTKVYRPFKTIDEHDEELVRRWNSVVRRSDVVFHLGDFCFGRDKLHIAERLNGDKRLILGNHDQYPSADYLRYFTKINGALQYKKMILTHIPVHPCQFERYEYNVHGHLHTDTLEDKRYINVSCERINLTPIHLDQLLTLNS